MCCDTIIERAEHRNRVPWPMTSLKFVSCLLLVLTYVAAARCPELNPSWVVDDDRIAGVISVEGRPLTKSKDTIVLSKRTLHRCYRLRRSVPDSECSRWQLLVHSEGMGRSTSTGQGRAPWRNQPPSTSIQLDKTVKQCLLLTLLSN